MKDKNETIIDSDKFHDVNFNLINESVTGDTLIACKLDLRKLKVAEHIYVMQDKEV